MSELLRLENLSAGYGDAVVLSGMSLTVAEGEADRRPQVATAWERRRSWRL